MGKPVTRENAVRTQATLPDELSGPGQQTPHGPQGPKRLTRADRRAYERIRARRKLRPQYAGETGRQRRERWEQERHQELARAGHRLGVGEMFTVGDRKRIVIALNQEAAERAGLTNAQWACMNRKQRAETLDRVRHEALSEYIAATGSTW